MYFFIPAFIFFTILLAAFVFAPQIAERRVLFDSKPDRPCGFGSDMAWIAVKANDPMAVLATLGIATATPANWNSGIGTVYAPTLGERHVFVSPPVEGWVFVVSQALPHPHGRSFADKCTPLLTELSQRLGEVQYFASYPELDLFA